MTLRNVFRIIRHDPLTLITNIAGLSLGLTASILLTVFIQFELSFDNHFTHKDRIFRLNSIWDEGGNRMIMPISLRKAYTEIPDQVTGIETALQIYQGDRYEVIQEENRFKDMYVLFADPGFFQLFDLEPVEGNLLTSLSEPGGAVLTRKIAERIFGTPQATGMSFEIDKNTYMVTAVIENIPPNTHFKFDLLLSMESLDNLDRLGGLEFFTYYLLEEGADPEPVLETICSENTRLLTARFANMENSTFGSNAEALEDLHLRSTSPRGLIPPGSMTNMVIMLIIAMIIMILALTNFINLYILNGAKRAGEIGIRKVNGASRPNLVSQFYLETTVVVTLAFLLAMALSLVLIPGFGRFMHRESFMEIISCPGLYLMLLVIYFTTILLSGIYPALLLSRSSPMALILGRVNPAGDKRMLLRIVSIFQLVITIFLLSTLVGIHTQTRYLKDLSPGYDAEGILLIHNLNENLIRSYPAIRDRLMEFPGVEDVAASGHIIGFGYSGQGIRRYGDAEDKNKFINEYRVQPGLCRLYRFNLVYGRLFDPEIKTDRGSIILNEAAVRMMGSTPEEIVGESLVMHSSPLKVIGIVEDFLYRSAAKEVEPMAITAYSEIITNIAIRIRTGEDPRVMLDRIYEAIKSFDKSYVLMNFYATEIYEEYYTNEERLQRIMGAGSIMAVIIVLLGIYALVSHNIIRRTKEIGIRKVMGGTSSRMLFLVYTSTLRWTAIAAVIAIPLGYLYLNNWLKDYSLRIPLHWWIFAGSIFLVLLFQTLITLGQTWKTARRNPVEALRYE